ncbi:dipeptidase [Thermosediminibacter litoriperuensis]|uniref:Membrane dipeptidase n=1 Tax=Thermosediminibacter litoriperuensis TaxID=291989 RepID=A0A5S5AH84_9FIRM|nr:dipeptidase [Thermosediminibacter litoriperuensis]TYP49760.1 membrane dipeptidase [Thermosediminibacter litoriperuensis]
MLVFDCHSDIWCDVANKRKKGVKRVLSSFHIPRLKKGNICGVNAAVWVEPQYSKNPTKRMLEILGSISEELMELDDGLVIVRNLNDLYRAIQEQNLFIILSMEGLSGIEGNLSFITTLYKLGIRIISLTWNEENPFAAGAGCNDPQKGLTALGKEAIKKMKELGIILDVSHLNEKSFWDVCEVAEKPFIASHSNSYRLCPNKRNLKDEQIKAIAAKGGVIGINAWPEFIHSSDPTLERMIDQVEYMVELAGIDHVGFGFDFCDYLDDQIKNNLQKDKIPTKKTEGLEDVTQVPAVVKELEKRGFKPADIEKICKGNFLRIFKEVL